MPYLDTMPLRQSTIVLELNEVSILSDQEGKNPAPKHRPRQGSAKNR